MSVVADVAEQQTRYTPACPVQIKVHYCRNYQSYFELNIVDFEVYFWHHCFNHLGLNNVTILSFQNLKRGKGEGSPAGKEMKRTRPSFQGCPLCFLATCPKIRRRLICVSFYKVLLCTIQFPDCVGDLCCWLSSWSAGLTGGHTASPRIKGAMNFVDTGLPHWRSFYST